MRSAFVPFVVLAASFSLANAQNKIDATLKPPPPPTNVNVLNFPEVQTVAGTVSVENLPLDVDGSVRVKCGPNSITYDLLDGSYPLPVGSEWSSVWVPSAEFAKFTVVVGIGLHVACLLEWRYATTDEQIWDLGPHWGYGYGVSNAASGEVVGPELRIQCSSSDADANIANVRVFLRK